MTVIDFQLKKIKNKEAVIGVIGLGYVGFPLAVQVAKSGYHTIGFDVENEKVKQGYNHYYYSSYKD